MTIDDLPQVDQKAAAKLIKSTVASQPIFEQILGDEFVSDLVTKRKKSNALLLRLAQQEDQHCRALCKEIAENLVLLEQDGAREAFKHKLRVTLYAPFESARTKLFFRRYAEKDLVLQLNSSHSSKARGGLAFSDAI